MQRESKLSIFNIYKKVGYCDILGSGIIRVNSRAYGVFANQQFGASDFAATFLEIHPENLTFDVFLHLGTLISTLVYFREEWKSVLRGAWGWVRGEGIGERPLWLFIALGTIPALVFGGLFHGYVAETLRKNEVLIFSLSIGGVLLFLADRFSRSSGTLDRLTPKRAVLIGVAQSFALIPGMSRSGSSIIGARLMGLGRSEAAKFSFLLSAPIILAAVVFELRNWQEILNGSIGLGPLLAGCVSAFLFGWIAIAGMLKFLNRFGFLSFAVYRVILAICVWKILGV